jgi:hypothetical protein
MIKKHKDLVALSCSPLWRVMSKYKTQHEDVGALMDTIGEHDLAKANYDLLLDVYLLAPKS